MKLQKIQREILQNREWIEEKPKRKSAAELGAKHAAKIAATRGIKESFGNNIISDILCLLTRRTISHS